MLFLTYYELNEEMSAEDTQEAAQAITGSGDFPPEDVELVNWVGTPDGWGVAIVEADDFEAVNGALNVWRTAAAGFFETTKTAPAAPAADIIAQQAALLDEAASP